MAGAAPLPMGRHRFQDLSLPSQPRDRSRPLAEILARRGHRTRQPRRRPRLEDVRGPLHDREPGLHRRRAATARRAGRRPSRTPGTCSSTRPTACASSTMSTSWPPSSGRPARPRAGSAGCSRVSRPGMRECEAVAPPRLERHAALVPPDAHGGAAGHPRPAQPGRPAHRAGRPVHDRVRHLGRADLPGRVRGRGCDRSCRPGSRDYVERLVGPYFAAVAEWYGALRVGQTGGALQEIIDRHLGDPFFGIFLNPGHQLHLDEWVNSPIAPGSTVELRSGMAFQVDIIPATGTTYFTTNIEDGVALADASLRAAFAARLPGRVGADPGAPAVHGGRPRHRPASRTSCRSRTSRPTCRRSCSAPTGP